jgi:SSS family transporter
LTSIDYLILCLYLAAMLMTGWFLRVKSGKDDDFFLAGRNMGWFPIGLSVMVTVFSAINYLALPNEVFGYGLYVIVALPVFFLAAWPITKIWMPFFHDMRLTSAYEYLELRFDKRVRSLGSGLFILWRLFWMATALFATAKIMGLLSGIPPPVIIIAGGLAATIYTFLGGMRAVMWTDVMQFFVLFGAIALGVFFAMGDGGFSELLQYAYNGGRLKPFAPFDFDFISPDPRIRMTLWSGLIGVFVAFLSRYGADQVVMQRYFSARSLKMAQRGLWLNAGVSVLSLSLLAIFGLAIYAYAVKNGAPVADWESLTMMQRKNIAMQQLAAVIRSFPPGITGLALAGLMAATMSSIDSGINACSAAYVIDFHKRFIDSGKQGLRLEKALTIGFGIFSTLLALALIPLVGKTNSLFMIVNKIINGLGSPLLALILLGMFSRRVNAPGMFYGGITGLLASLFVSFLVKSLALQYYAVLNLAVSLAPCFIFSRIAETMGYVQTEEKTQWSWRAWKKRNKKNQNELFNF